MPKSIGEQIKEARVRKKLKQDGLGELMHVTRSSVSHWETGHTPPDEHTLRRLEEILECKFETEQPPEEQEENSAKSSTFEAAKRKIARAIRKQVPVWLCAAIAAGVFAIMLVIMLCVTANLNGQLKAYENKYNANNNQPIAENTLAWYQQTVRSQDGKAYVTVEIEPDPVLAVPDPDGKERGVWFYTITFTERNGIPFEVDEILFQSFNGSAKRGAKVIEADELIEIWGNYIIPAHGQQIITGGMPVQDVSNTGILIKGKDTDGNVMEFRGIINYSQEMAE